MSNQLTLTYVSFADREFPLDLLIRVPYTSLPVSIGLAPNKRSRPSSATSVVFKIKRKSTLRISSSRTRNSLPSAISMKLINPIQRTANGSDEQWHRAGKIGQNRTIDSCDVKREDPMDTQHKRSASITFRGFALAPEEVQLLVGVGAKLLSRKGTQMNATRPNVWQRSAAKFAVEFDDDFPIVDMIPALLSHTGGVEHLCLVRDKVLPEFFEINLVLPIKFSESQDDGYLTAETLQDLCRLRATLGLGFV
jgi:hypothetical protein